MLVLSRVVGFGTSPQTAFLFFIGYGAVALILLVALSMAGYRPGAGVALWDAPVVATLVAPLSLLATVVTPAWLQKRVRSTGGSSRRHS